MGLDIGELVEERSRLDEINDEFTNEPYFMYNIESGHSGIFDIVQTRHLLNCNNCAVHIL